MRHRLNKGELEYKFETTHLCFLTFTGKNEFNLPKKTKTGTGGQVIFEDKATFTLQTHKNKRWIRRGSIKILRKVEHALKVHVWGCISSNGFGQIFCFVPNLSSDLMCKIYSKKLVYSAIQLYGEGEKEWQLYEDNDPKQMSKLCKAKKVELSINRITTLP